ncbi:murein biosynthesis integral membrane protein MurJ [Clostridium sp. CCUG 7971]|uniref:murein biosynthesis integral membrane protein MurJ n=1 Tax=Clostridium sp. CCUG 7971 TaxID=2811414 RepID=UPI001ABA10D0|nr:murein biosynthesis integral membrane protein MurJ [Clostridium sp. CCUG 7971]MBO3443033.1 murein biosynthesis integral membrane protein MurJ [Clostridium sp. CCUG 7971]
MSKTAKAALWIMVATMISKMLGFFREVALAGFYGTGTYSDVFVLTLNIPGLIIAVVGSAIATIYVPIYIDTREKLGEEEALKFTNNMLNIVAVLSIVIAILGLLFTEEFISVFAGGFEGEKFTLAVNFTKIMIVGVIFLSISKILSTFLQVNESFTVPSLIGIPYNIFIISAIAISTKTNPIVMAIGALLGMASQMLFQLPFAIKRGYKYKSYLNIKDKNIKNAMILMLPMLIGVAIGQINTTVDKALASGLGDGPLSALNYASKLNDFVMALFVTSIVTVIYPKLAKMTSSENKDNFISTIVKSSNFIVLLVLPITVGAIVLAEPIVRILFQRKAFDAESTYMTYTALRFYSLGLVAMGVRDILTRVFYSLSDTKTPMINGSIALVINIILNLILIKPLGYIGIAISTSIASIITIILLFISLKKKTGYFGGDKIIITGIKSLVAAIVMGVVTIFAYNGLYNLMEPGKLNDIISVSISVMVGAGVYGLLIIIFKIEEVKLVFDIIDKTKNKLLKR